MIGTTISHYKILEKLSEEGWNGKIKFVTGLQY